MTTLGNRSSTGHYTRSVEDPQFVQAQKDNDSVVNCFRPDKYLFISHPSCSNCQAGCEKIVPLCSNSPIPSGEHYWRNKAICASV